MGLPTTRSMTTGSANTQLPQDFSSQDYYHLNQKVIEDELNYSSSDMDLVLKEHYLKYGQNKGLPYKLEIPEDFSLKKLIELNDDLHALRINRYLDLPDTDVNLEEAYMHCAGPCSRLYKLILPPDFCVAGYKRYNKDLADLPDDYVKKHYNQFGKKENRVYRVELPEGFDAAEYKHVNPDLAVFSNAEAEQHYYMYGANEKRSYKDEYFDKDFFISKYGLQDYQNYNDFLKDPRRAKSQYVLDEMQKIDTGKIDLLLISHETSLYGATHYLYTLYTYIKENYPAVKVAIAEKYKNTELFRKYNLNEENVYFYSGDCALLYNIIEKSAPTKILVNSTPGAVNALVNHIPRDKLIYHSHEIKEHFAAMTFDVVPDYVVSGVISAEWNNTPKVQPPFLDKIAIKALNEARGQTSSVTNNFGAIDETRITIGMCGSLTERKNPGLFVQLAEALPDYNFLWVGGYSSITDKDIKNLYHVQNVTEPYSYFQLFDYFLLTSAADPCPYVVLENLYSNVPVMVFKENIYTRHDLDALAGVYFEIPGKICLEGAKQAIRTTCLGKRDKNNTQGNQYVLANFTKPTDQYIRTILNLT
jgi:hypothetical protein